MAVEHLVSSGRSLRSRSVPCSGVTIAELREFAGMTQAELAQRSGYSTRLIRKAESGGPLATRTIRDLAEALSTTDRPISPEDLILTELRLATRVLDTFLAARSGYWEEVLDAFALDAKLICSGIRETFPFSGSWRGKEGIRRWGRTLRHVLGSQLGRFRTVEAIRSTGSVVIWGHFPVDSDFYGINDKQIALRFRFSELQIKLLEVLFDGSDCVNRSPRVPLRRQGRGVCTQTRAH